MVIYNPHPDETLLTPKEVAQRLRISTTQVRSLFRKGKINGVKLGWRTLRFRERDVAAFVQSRLSVPIFLSE